LNGKGQTAVKGWIEVTVWADGKPTNSLVSIPLAAISQVGSMAGHGLIKRVDAGGLETAEDYAALLAKIEEAT
jgi:hypothetical protein